MIFTQDWISHNFSTWEKYLNKYKGKENVRAIEIGTYEGMSTLWFLSNILTHSTSSIITIDKLLRQTFYDNINQFSHKVRCIEGFSQIVLRSSEFKMESFSFAYIDGGHESHNVLEDAILIWRLVEPTGTIIFDDYEWKPENEENKRPKKAIDMFLVGSIN